VETALGPSKRYSSPLNTVITKPPGERHANRREGHGTRWLRRALEYIHAHASDSIGLAEVAREAGVHPVYFARAFRAQTGLPVGAYLRKLRVDRAAEKLASTNLRIAATYRQRRRS
jgi:AraC-like DNA-binding protein